MTDSAATLVLEGGRIEGIPSLYDELNRVFMPNEEWTLGPSLDALDDLLYGGFGALHEISDDAPVRVLLRDHAHARDALGHATTREYYLAKLAQPEMFNVKHFEAKLAELDAGDGPTYFEIVCEIFAQHPNVRLVLA